MVRRSVNKKDIGQWPLDCEDMRLKLLIKIKSKIVRSMSPVGVNNPSSTFEYRPLWKLNACMRTQDLHAHFIVHRMPTLNFIVHRMATLN